MSVLDKAFGTIKSAMLINEKFEGIEQDLKGLGADIADLARSHADLAQRVARLEGFLEGAAAATRAPRIEG